MSADNDLAFGHFVEAFSQSAFWSETAIFAIEDDPQAGWDHISGYRTTAMLPVPTPSAASRISTNYNTTSILRTIEQYLGMRPIEPVRR